MPSRPDAPRIDQYEAADEKRSDSSRFGIGVSIRWVGFLAMALALAFVAAYERLVVADGEHLVGSWEPTATDWLFYLSLVAFFWFVLLPLATNRERTARYWGAVRNDPVALFCLCYLALFFVAGTIGAAIVPHVRPTLTEPYQPPVFAWASMDVVGDCLGRTVGGNCLGTASHPFGTDLRGRSLFPVVVEGSRVSLQVAFVVSMIAVPIALAVGTVAGYFGGWVDTALMRYVDVQQTVPAFLVYLILSYVFGRSLFLFVLVFGLLSWGAIARIVRSEVLQLREQLYVTAAKSYGVRRGAILNRHLLPNLSGTVLTAFTQQISWIILVEAALSFLGLTTGSVESWGRTITNGFQLQSSFVETWWLMTIPGVALMLTVISFAVVGDRLRDVSDPRQYG